MPANVCLETKGTAIILMSRFLPSIRVNRHFIDRLNLFTEAIRQIKRMSKALVLRMIIKQEGIKKSFQVGVIALVLGSLSKEV